MDSGAVDQSDLVGATMIVEMDCKTQGGFYAYPRGDPSSATFTPNQWRPLLIPVTHTFVPACYTRRRMIVIFTTLKNFQALNRRDYDLVQSMGYAMTRNHATDYEHVGSKVKILVPRPAMQGLRQKDVKMFAAETQKPQVNLDVDHYSVFSDDDSISAEEDKENNRHPGNFAAALARDMMDDERKPSDYSGDGVRYQDWAILLSLGAISGGTPNSGSSVETQADANESRRGSLTSDAVPDDVEDYNLTACQERIYCSSDYNVFETSEMGSAAHIVENANSDRDRER